MAPLYPSASNNPPNNDNHNDDDDDLHNNVLLDWLGAGSGVTVIPTTADATGAATSAADNQEEEDAMATTVSDSDDITWGPLPWLSTSDTSSSSHHLLPTDSASRDYYFDDNHVDDLECLDAVEVDNSSYFGFARSNYMESIRTWTCGNTSSPNAAAVTAAAAAADNDPSPHPWTAASRHTASSSLLPMTVNTDGVDSTRDFKHDDGDLLLFQADDHSDECPPPMVRSTSDSLSSEETADEDETMSDSTTSTSDDEEEDDADADDSSVLSDTDSTPPPTLPRGVTFNEQVRVLPIPPIEHYTPEQRYKMYANRFELRENKLRNKREYEFDNYDWRNATEEHCMAICPMSGELLHPAHF